MKDKLISLLLLSFLILSNLSCVLQQKTGNNLITSKKQSNKLKIEKIELKEQTRGTNRIITFTPISKITSLNGEITTIPLSSEQWKDICKQVSLLDLSKISTYQSSTMSRFSGGALASSISIFSNGKEYVSSTFDSGTPPKELEGLYNSISLRLIKNNPKTNIR